MRLYEQSVAGPTKPPDLPWTYWWQRHSLACCLALVQQRAIQRAMGGVG